MIKKLNHGPRVSGRAYIREQVVDKIVKGPS